MQNGVESLANADALVSHSFTLESYANRPKLPCRNEQFGLIRCEEIEVDRIMLPKAVSHPTAEEPSHICSNITFHHPLEQIWKSLLQMTSHRRFEYRAMPLILLRAWQKKIP